MALPSGVNKSVIIGKQSGLGTIALTSAGKQMRRTSATINLVKNSYESAEIRTDYQVVDSRHGTRRVEGTLGGELSCLTYSEVMASVLRGSWASGATTGVVTTIEATASGNMYERASGSFVSDGFKVGDPITVTGFTTAGNNGQATVVSVSALELAIDGLTLTDEAAGDSVTIASPKKLIVPSTGHSNDYWTIESFYEMGATDVSERATDCKFSTMTINIQPDAMATVEFGVLGRTVATASAAYFVTPTAPTTTQVQAGAGGKLYRNGVGVGIVTGLSLTVDGGMETGSVVGANMSPDVFVGRVRVTGQFTAYFEDSSLWEAFDDEDDVSLTFRLDSADGSETMVIKLPRIKLNGAEKDDPETGGIVQTIPFTAVKYVGTGAYENTTIAIVDSEVS